MNILKKYLKLLRIEHSLKNVLIVLPILFTGTLSISHVPLLLLGFITFSFVSSIIYIFNDIQDVEKD